MFNKSGKTHGGEERNSRNSVASLKIYEPTPLLLKYTFATKSMRAKNSIEARLCGFGLITTIKQTDETITNLSNFVAVQVYKRNAVDVSDFGVCRLPINTVGNCSVHLEFNLTHLGGSLCLVCVYHSTGSGGSGGLVDSLRNWHNGTGFPTQTMISCFAG